MLSFDRQDFGKQPDDNILFSTPWYFALCNLRRHNFCLGVFLRYASQLEDLANIDSYQFGSLLGDNCNTIPWTNINVHRWRQSVCWKWLYFSSDFYPQSVDVYSSFRFDYFKHILDNIGNTFFFPWRWASIIFMGCFEYKHLVCRSFTFGTVYSISVHLCYSQYPSQYCENSKTCKWRSRVILSNTNFKLSPTEHGDSYPFSPRYAEQSNALYLPSHAGSAREDCRLMNGEERSERNWTEYLRMWWSIQPAIVCVAPLPCNTLHTTATSQARSEPAREKPPAFTRNTRNTKNTRNTMICRGGYVARSWLRRNFVFWYVVRCCLHLNRYGKECRKHHAFL